jgi:DNA-binding transcriptional MerR regulator
VPSELTIDELAAATGTTTRSIRSFQSMGLLDPPDLRGRIGIYGTHHADRIGAILRLQAEGFSLASLTVLFAAHARGETLDQVLGLPEAGSDTAELYGFADLLVGRRGRRPVRGRPLLSVVPTTLWDETEAS